MITTFFRNHEKFVHSFFPDKISGKCEIYPCSSNISQFERRAICMIVYTWICAFTLSLSLTLSQERFSRKEAGHFSDSTQPDFVRPLVNAAYNSAEERIKRNINSVQRSRADQDKNFTKRWISIYLFWMCQYA